MVAPPKRAPDWIPWSRERWVGNPSLGQIFQVYRDCLRRITENQESEGFPVESAPARARNIARRILKVSSAQLTQAIAAASEASIDELKAFTPPRKLRLETLGLEADPAFLKRAGHTYAIIRKAQWGPSVTLRRLLDLLAFDFPVDPLQVQEAIQLCDGLVNALSKLRPMALCPQCKGKGCDTCGGAGYLTVGAIPDISVDLLLPEDDDYGEEEHEND